MEKVKRCEHVLKTGLQTEKTGHWTVLILKILLPGTLILPLGHQLKRPRQEVQQDQVRRTDRHVPVKGPSYCPWLSMLLMLLDASTEPMLSIQPGSNLWIRGGARSILEDFPRRLTQAFPKDAMCVMVKENQCRRPMSYLSPRISSELGLELRETQTEREIGRERDGPRGPFGNYDKHWKKKHPI